MRDAGIGRLLVAALHQAIADVLPDRLEFYENWLSPRGLRDGTIGLAPLNAVLSFLRLEGDAYETVMARAGDNAGEWTLGELAPRRRRMIRALPGPLRRRAALGVVRRLVLATYSGCRVRTRARAGTIEIHGSVFCNVRDRSPRPLCRFYAAAAAAVLRGLGVPARSDVQTCQATGGPGCRIATMHDVQEVAAPAAEMPVLPVEPGEPVV